MSKIREFECIDNNVAKAIVLGRDHVSVHKLNDSWGLLVGRTTTKRYVIAPFWIEQLDPKWNKHTVIDKVTVSAKILLVNGETSEYLASMLGHENIDVEISDVWMEGINDIIEEIEFDISG